MDQIKPFGTMEHIHVPTLALGQEQESMSGPQTFDASAVYAAFGEAPISAAAIQKLRVVQYFISTDDILSADVVFDGVEGPAVWDPDAKEWDLF